ncbi:MAG TPA: hypothetical protein VHO03_03655 [Ignavibacteriales bacterium]|nr:hypothetical protein [Ignavibacteriales bacterium]
MKVQTGNRKFIGFIILVAAFLLICLAVLALAVILKGDKFNITEFGGLFTPLATGLMLIGAPFFAANAAVHTFGKPENKAEGKQE